MRNYEIAYLLEQARNKLEIANDVVDPYDDGSPFVDEEFFQELEQATEQLQGGVSEMVCTEKDDEHDRQVNIRIKDDGDTILIKPEGYGDFCSMDGDGMPILIEMWNDALRAVVWGDINQEDPTHIISLEDAKEELREED